MRLNIVLIIISMFVVTYVPRALPVFFADSNKLSATAERFLGYIPYAAVGALVFPGIFSISAEVFPTLLAIAAAFILAVKVKNMTLTIVATTAVFVIAVLI